MAMARAVKGFVYISNAGLFPKFIQAIEEPIKKAAALTMAQIGKDVIARGTAQIAAGGLGSRWQRGLNFRVYTDSRVPTEIAATSFYHRIGLFNVFERGISISPGKLMWLPVSGLAKQFSVLGKRRLTPEKYAKTVGPLVSVNVPGKPPMLFARADLGKRGNAKVTLARLKRGAAGTGTVGSVPLFVGVPAVRIRKRFDISGVVKRAMDNLPKLFAKFFKGNA
jgi:hypothetical protein